MANEIPGASTFSAKALLSLALKQYCFVKLNSSGEVIAVAADTDRPVGILQNAPLAGETAEVMLRGVSKCKCNAAGVTCGTAIGPDSVGRCITRVFAHADNLHFAAGIALDTTGAQADQINSVLLTDPYPVMIVP